MMKLKRKREGIAARVAVRLRGTLRPNVLVLANNERQYYQWLFDPPDHAADINTVEMTHFFFGNEEKQLVGLSLDATWQVVKLPGWRIGKSQAFLERLAHLEAGL